MLWLVVLAVGLSAVSLYYYLQVLKQIYVVAPPESAARFRPSPVFRVGVVTLAVATVVFGCFPNLLVGRLTAALAAAGF